MCSLESGLGAIKTTKLWTLSEKEEEGGTLGSDVTLNLVGVFVIVYC